MCEETTCNICRAYELRDDLILCENAPARFEMALDLYRPNEADRDRLRAERQRMIDAGEPIYVVRVCEPAARPSTHATDATRSGSASPATLNAGSWTRMACRPVPIAGRFPSRRLSESRQPASGKRSGSARTSSAPLHLSDTGEASASPVVVQVSETQAWTALLSVRPVARKITPAITNTTDMLATVSCADSRG